MTSDPHARRRMLIERFQVATRAQLDVASRECLRAEASPEGPSRIEALANLRSALQGIKGDAQMLGLVSYASFTEQLDDQLETSATALLSSQTLVGLEWLREWVGDELVEDASAQSRLAEGRVRLAAQASVSASEISSPGLPGTGRSVLLVEHSALVQMMVEDSLLDAGFEVEAVASGAEALRAVEAHTPGLVLSGVKMPGMSGFELLEQLQSRWPELPVVLLSGVRSAADEARARTLGARGYFLKEADLDPLVRYVLEHARD